MARFFRLMWWTQTDDSSGLEVISTNTTGIVEADFKVGEW